MMFDRKKSVQRRSAISFSFSQKILFHHVCLCIDFNFEDFDHIQMRDANVTKLVYLVRRMIYLFNC